MDGAEMTTLVVADETRHPRWPRRVEGRVGDTRATGANFRETARIRCEP